MTTLKLIACGSPRWISKDPKADSIHGRYLLREGDHDIGWIQAKAKHKWFHQRADGYCATLEDAFNDLMRALGRAEKFNEVEQA